MKTPVLCLALLMVASVVSARPPSFDDTSIQQDDTTPLANVASRRRSGGEGASGDEGVDALGDAFHLVAQGLGRLQEALRLQEAERRAQDALHLQEQRAAAALREAVRQIQHKLQERDETIHSHGHSLNERMQKVEERLNVLENQLIPSERGGAAAGRQVSIDTLENRIQNLEASVEKALELQERHSHPVDPSAIPLTSTAPSTSPSLFAASPSLPASASASAPGAEAHEEDATAEEEELARQRLKLRIREVKAKRDRAIASPSSMGEDLCKAAKEGTLREVRQLIDSGADVNYTNEDGFTPLTNAALSVSRNADVVSLLLERGADVNGISVSGWSPLHYSADKDGRIVALLIAAGADVDARLVHGETPLHWAALNHNVNGVRALLAGGARKNLRPWSGRRTNQTPFDVAQVDAVRDLLRP